MLSRPHSGVVNGTPDASFKIQMPMVPMIESVLPEERQNNEQKLNFQELSKKISKKKEEEKIERQEKVESSKK